MGPYGGGSFDGADGGNPFVSGLVTAVNIAGHLQQQALARQQEARARAKDARDAEIQQQNADWNDAELSTKLSGMGARTATSQDLIDSKTGTLPANRMVKFGKKQWVLPSEEETAARKKKEFQTKLDQEAQTKEAEGNATERGRYQALTDHLNAVGIPISDEDAAMTHLPKGTKILPEHVDDFARTVREIRAAEAQKAESLRRIEEKKYAGKEVNDDGTGTIIFQDGSTLRVPNMGKKTAKTAAGGAAGLTPNAQGVQNRFNSREEAADAKLQGQYQQQEQELWAQKQPLEQALASDGKTQVPNPLNPKQLITLNDLNRTAFTSRLAGNAKKIENLQNLQKQIRQKHGWGIPDEAKQHLKEGIVTTFGNGQRWTLKGGQASQVQ
jgi:hypothetical protein